MVKDFKLNSKFYKVTLWVILWMISSVQEKKITLRRKFTRYRSISDYHLVIDSLEFIQGNIDKISGKGPNVDKFSSFNIDALDICRVARSCWWWGPHRHIGNPKILRLLFLGL